MDLGWQAAAVRAEEERCPMHDETRRRFVVGAVGAGASLLVASCAKPAEPKVTTTTAGERTSTKHAHEGEEISPTEDLMREHGVLDRLLLVYDEGARRLEAQQPLPLEVIAGSAEIIRRFIEEYHGKLEEDFVFPRFERANTLVALTATLRRQHHAGRGLTDTILRLATSGADASSDDGRKLAPTMRLFARMFRPHEGREDTVLFPAFRTIVTAKELAALGEQFEDKEHELFGKDGFQGIVAQVAKLEQALGIHDLDQFTPATT
jgi:hemerythrin-like domain-containing protein